MFVRTNWTSIIGLDLSEKKKLRSLKQKTEFKSQGKIIFVLDSAKISLKLKV